MFFTFRLEGLKLNVFPFLFVAVFNGKFKKYLRQKILYNYFRESWENSEKLSLENLKLPKFNREKF